MVESPDGWPCRTFCNLRGCALRPGTHRSGGSEWGTLYESEARGSARRGGIGAGDGRGWRIPSRARWSRHRSRLFGVPHAAFIELAPDWACEVISPRSQRIDRERKLPIYARERVTNVWLVDPLARMIEVYRLDGESYRLLVTRGGVDSVRLEPFEALELELAALWPAAASDAK